jgi:hypothetical protein
MICSLRSITTQIVISETGADAPVSLKAVKLLAQYMSGGDKESIVGEITAMVGGRIHVSRRLRCS